VFYQLQSLGVTAVPATRIPTVGSDYAQTLSLFVYASSAAQDPQFRESLKENRHRSKQLASATYRPSPLVVSNLHDPRQLKTPVEQRLRVLRFGD